MTIITQKEARRLKRPMTIDLREISAHEYIEAKQTKLQKVYYFITGLMGTVGIIFFIATATYNWAPIFTDVSADQGKHSFEDLFGEERVIIGCYNDITKKAREGRRCTQKGDHNIMTPPQRDIETWKKYYSESQIINRLALVNFESGFTETANNPSAHGYVQTLRSHGVSPKIDPQLAWMHNREQTYRQRYFQGNTGRLDGCGKYWDYDNTKDGYEAGEYGVLACLYRFHYHAKKGTWYAKRGVEVTKFYKEYFSL